MKMQLTRLISLAAPYLSLSRATSDLLPFETIQLQARELESLDATSSSLLSFADTSSPLVTTNKRSKSGCKYFPGDADWPSDEAWNTLNYTLGGVLIKTVPLARACYAGPDYVSNTPLVLYDFPAD